MKKSRKNKLAGNHPSYGNMSEKSRKRKIAYDKAYSASKKRKKYRAELNKKNRDAGTYGNGDKKDVSHKKNGKTTMENQKINRARQGRNGKSTKK